VPNFCAAMQAVDQPLEPIFCGGNQRTTQEREQWASACNTFAVRPGVVLSYDRNDATLTELATAGFRLVPAVDLLTGDENLSDSERAVITIDVPLRTGGTWYRSLGNWPWAIGVAYPDLGVISVAMRRGAQYSDPAATMRHELAHIALGAALGERAPHWLHEGFAYQHSREWSWERAETLAGMAWFGSIIPIEALDAAFPAEENAAHRAYAESYDFVGFLTRRGRYEDTSDDGDRWPFRRFLADIGRGTDPDVAARNAFGRSLKQLFDEWKLDLGQRYMLMPIGLFGLVLWILCALLLVLAYLRRRRLNKRRIAQWDLEDAQRRERAARIVNIPPYVPWPGKDPLLDEEELDGETKPPGPRLMN